MRHIALAFLLSVCALAWAEAMDGITTTFLSADVQAVVGQDIVIGSPLVINNISTNSVHVTISGVIPSPSALRNAVAIPDVSWLRATPSDLDIPPRGHAQSQLSLQIPNEKSLAGHTYQVMICSKMIPRRAKGMPIAGAILSRLRISVAKGKSTP
jgi:hypothetical protein